ALARRLIVKARSQLNDEERRQFSKVLDGYVVTEAKLILHGNAGIPPFSDFKVLISALKGALHFRLAHDLIVFACGSGIQSHDRTWLIQQQALCIYKDEDRLPRERLDTAMELLNGIGLRDPNNTNAETLALGGAIYKRKWEFDGQLEDLHEAVALYNAAWQRNPQADMGYGGINAAFILELLAARLRIIGKRTGTKIQEAAELAGRAMKLREEVAAFIEKCLAQNANYAAYEWIAITLAEAYFGLQRYDDAARWLAQAHQLYRSEWEQQTTFKQFVALATAQGIEPPSGDIRQVEWHPAWLALKELLPENTTQAFSCFRGKVGLALSGGGFRAALFHIGVLARLAEIDALRSVEVLSTVSGGSIVGAHYYLEVRKLLCTQAEENLSKVDYIKIVQRVQRNFLDAIQNNLRMRILTDLWENIAMVFGRTSRSERLGELYERYIYTRVDDGHHSGTARPMKDLLIHPAVLDSSTKHVRSDLEFNPKFSNWRRHAKIPVILLNATSLNTGHSWQFTAKSMGEPPGLVDGDIDANERYRRLWYQDAPNEALRNYRLGHAVAASSCVPGLFEPLPINGLYPGRIVRLVDGGVHDNQGVDGLLNEGCTFILCSDACGQMSDLAKPSDSSLGVPVRSNSILMDRVREVEYQDLKGRVDSRALQGLFFIHLKKGLMTEPIEWINCQDPNPPVADSSTKTDYHVDKELQAQLAALRTDLDSFSEVEAYALMLSGYLMTEQEVKALDEQHRRDGHPGIWGGYDIDAPRGQWKFLELLPLIDKPATSSDL
ncbi:MAG TPA: patatin-like phospholipase family protein, partial [Candidatus Binatus sp.]|nr:patatin-like phospholipase family protein [Candidatus Binatus sp.]